MDAERRQRTPGLDTEDFIGCGTANSVSISIFASSPQAKFLQGNAKRTRWYTCSTRNSELRDLHLLWWTVSMPALCSRGRYYLSSKAIHYTNFLVNIVQNQDNQSVLAFKTCRNAKDPYWINPQLKAGTWKRDMPRKELKNRTWALIGLMAVAYFTT